MIDGAPQIVTLQADGQFFGALETVDVTMSLEAPARSFVAVGFQNFAGDLVVRPGSVAVLLLNGAPLVTGWVDDPTVAKAPGGSNVQLPCRSRTCDLVDSAPAPTTPRRWVGASPLVIAAAICAPFDVAVTAAPGAPLDPVPRFGLEDHATAWDQLDRLLSSRGLLAVDDAIGNLQLLRLSDATALRHVGVLAAGANLLDWSVAHRGSERFATYLAKGQTVADTVTPPSLAAAVYGVAADADVARPRWMHVDAHGLDAAGALAKARWEATTRYGRAVTVSCVTPGWTDAAGTPWTPGRMVQVSIPHAGLLTELVVVEVTLRKAPGTGTTSSITLQPVEAFAAYVPVRRPRRGARAYEGGTIDVKAAAARAEAYR